MKIRWLAALVLTAVFTQAPINAQPAGEALVEGPTMEGKPFKLASLKGKVVLLMFWSTQCAICRDNMPELRLNYEGWKDRPFTIVLVSGDSKLKDLQDYEQIITRMVPAEQRLVRLWSGEPGYKDSFGPHAHLPTTYLIDKSGKVVQKYVGRIPGEEWNRIAELVYS